MCVLSIAASLLLASCGDEDRNHGTAAPPLTSAMVMQRGPFAVGVTRMIFVDASRPTMPNGTYPGAPSRSLTTEIWYPTDPGPSAGEDENRDVQLARSGGPFPLIIYSHGFMSGRTGGGYLARHMASYGYVTASPDFPLTRFNAPGGANLLDVVEQPRDVSFLIDQILALSNRSDSFLSGGIDAQRIGLTGLSLGGMTTFLATFHPTLRDARVRAAAPTASPACFFGPGFFDGRSIPLLILHGDIDAIVPYQQSGVFAFQEARPPKYLATIVGGSHTGFTDGIEVFDSVNNVDEIGCSGLDRGGSNLGDGSLLDRLGGAAAGIIIGDCPAGCTGGRHLPHAVRPTRQHELTILSVFPFFEATLRNDARARQFLQHTLATENPEITIQLQK